MYACKANLCFDLRRDQGRETQPELQEPLKA